MSDMEEILTELQRMMEVNPEAYQKIMESMSKSLYSSGTNTNDNLPPHVTTGGNSGQGNNMSINQMAEAIMHMRNASSVDVEGKESDLIMSKEKPKQVKIIDTTMTILEVFDHFLIIDDDDDHRQ